jgi:uncharacterized membrane protein YdjX (TVP38/TMEM64 family)
MDPVEIIERIRAAGAAGWLVFAAIYVAATVLVLPASVLGMVAGFVWGPLHGTLIVSPVSVVAAAAAFGLGHSTARRFVARRLAGRPRLRALDDAIGTTGWRTVLLLRLSPLMPFAALNYALSLSRVRLSDFLLGSWIGMLPGTVLYVYLGSLAGAAGGLGRDRVITPVERAAWWLGLAATVTAVLLVRRAAKKAPADPGLPSDEKPASPP